MPLERDCSEIVLCSVLKSVRRGLSDGSALDRPRKLDFPNVLVDILDEWILLFNVKRASRSSTQYWTFATSGQISITQWQC